MLIYKGGKEETYFGDRILAMWVLVKMKWRIILKEIAHVKVNENGIWQTPHWLDSHLLGTSQMAEAFAAKFQSAAWGRILGLTHDLGKGRPIWQEYLKSKSGYAEDAHLEHKVGKIPHAIHGAKIVEEVFDSTIARLLGYCIAGHHTGLPDWSSASGGQASLEYRLEHVKDADQVASNLIKELEDVEKPRPPWRFDNSLDLSFWIRMLFSCLVDADFLNTEEYMDPKKTSIRGNFCTLEELYVRFNAYYDGLVSEAEDTKVNLLRRRINDKCVRAGQEPQGAFSLSVPTGGGKTLASLAFALEHAVTHNLDRIIYVIPYTSIIEQNAEVFKKALGDDQVIEHHSSFDEEGSTLRSCLAAENWDAPLIVTTSVQFFESLFAAKPSRTRKLHNIINSVIILDEAQLIPTDYLEPVMEIMQLLIDKYGVSFVISTATQPLFSATKVGEEQFNGLKEIKEIIGERTDVETLYSDLSRVDINLPEDLASPVAWEELVENLISHQQVLCVVSDRRSCRELHSLMPKGTYHLSALMCGEHRSKVIREIKEGLKCGKKVRVISTQLVEAGVDLDFPVVYRAIAGLDSLAQAAGRCNREGKMKQKGKVFIFIPPRRAPVGLLRKAVETTEGLLLTSKYDDLFHPELFTKYFIELYSKVSSLDRKEIIKLLTPTPPDIGINFRTAANKFVFIDQMQRSILVRYGESDKLIENVGFSGPERGLMRRLQRYTVGIYETEFYEMLSRGAIEEISPEIYALVSNLDYDDTIGLLIEQTLHEAKDMIF